jgi:hypothetical protein
VKGLIGLSICVSHRSFPRTVYEYRPILRNLLQLNGLAHIRLLIFEPGLTPPGSNL